MRLRLIMEIEYTGVVEEDEDELRAHLATFVHASAKSDMLTPESLPDSGVSRCGALCQRLEDPQVVPDPSREGLDVGHHACPDSPHGICEYDLKEDPAADQCVHCGDPEERK